MGRPTGLIGPASSRPTLGYRFVAVAIRFLGRRVFAFRTEVVGRERLPRRADGRPAGGWIAAGLPHRTWVDPFVVLDALPRDPRLVFFGDGPAIFRSPLRRWLVRWIGGVIPIWPGGGRAAVEAHLEGATCALHAGAIVCLFPETGPPTPPGTTRPLGLGLAYFALRTDRPVVPLVLGGTHELFRGRRFQLTVLEPMTVRDLADLPPDADLPPPWSSAERRLAHRITVRLHEVTAAPVATAHAATTPPPGTRRRWRWLQTAWH
ncbi:MAG: 1-acyl-sn-glycerol-3-phosphate acyltransferase [Chloroflexota bacterium]|nr:1-acyl-sn-glycerol-3-phosphate acyltransferase [Chloroflexota bacterium]MDH5242690.1 1-acyl-sn-glycerol-3-phosphate acyltransferase [Chloroflexota bacterium]